MYNNKHNMKLQQLSFILLLSFKQYATIFGLHIPKVFSSSIVSIKNKHTFINEEREQFITKNPFINNKKIISINPGGYRGFYMFGISKFIKKQYNLENFLFSGASAGAWLSLFLCYRGDISDIEKLLIDPKLENTNSISKMQSLMKHRILTKFNTDDFDLRRLFIGVTTAGKCSVSNVVYCDFEDLEDAVNCCIASSHIPFITGKLYNKYRGKYTFDGGFSSYPYLNTSTPHLHITPFFWDKMVYSKIDIETYATMFSRDKYNFVNLIENGYFETFENKKYMDQLFLE